MTEQSHTTRLEVLTPPKKDGPKFQAHCSCGWRSGFVRYAKHNAQHDEFVHIREVQNGDFDGAA